MNFALAFLLRLHDKVDENSESFTVTPRPQGAPPCAICTYHPCLHAFLCPCAEFSSSAFGCCKHTAAVHAHLHASPSCRAPPLQQSTGGQHTHTHVARRTDERQGVVLYLRLCDCAVHLMRCCPVGNVMPFLPIQTQTHRHTQAHTKTLVFVCLLNLLLPVCTCRSSAPATGRSTDGVAHLLDGRTRGRCSRPPARPADPAATRARALAAASAAVAGADAAHGASSSPRLLSAAATAAAAARGNAASDGGSWGRRGEATSVTAITQQSVSWWCIGPVACWSTRVHSSVCCCFGVLPSTIS